MPHGGPAGGNTGWKPVPHFVSDLLNAHIIIGAQPVQGQPAHEIAREAHRAPLLWDAERLAVGYALSHFETGKEILDSPCQWRERGALAGAVPQRDRRTAAA